MIISVPHTGTRSLIEITGYQFMHSYEYMTPQDLINRNGDEVLCAPLRDPWEVWKTWFQRYGGRKYLMDPDHPKSYESAWRAMAALDRHFEIVYIPVDSRWRDIQLAELSVKMGEHLKTDWSPVAARPDHKKQKPVREKDLDWIYQLPFVSRFYGNVRQ